MTGCLEEAQPNPDQSSSVCSDLVETADSAVLDSQTTTIEIEQGSNTDKSMIFEQLAVVEQPEESSDVGIDKDADPKPPQPSQGGSRRVLMITDSQVGKGGSLTSNTLRQLRLDGFYLFIKELRGRIGAMDHIPIYKNRWTASISTAPHLLGVFATIALSSFILPEFYIGAELQGISGQDSEKLLALVIGAKIMELLTVFSLSTTVFTMVRHELVLGQGVPLAALGAGLQISDPTFLISKELLAIFKGKFSANWKKCIFSLLIFAFTILAVCIAPASATAMMPQNSWWQAGGTQLWWNSTETALFPGTLNETHTLGSVCNVTGSLNCPSYQWQIIAEQLILRLQVSAQVVNGRIKGIPPPTSLIVQGRDTRLELGISIREQPYDVFIANYTVAYMPHGAIGDAFLLGSLSWNRAALTSHQVLVAIPGDPATQLADLYGCMIDARWVVATLQSDESALVTGGIPPSFVPSGDPINGTGWIIDETYGSRAHIRPSFAQYVDPGIQNSTFTVLQMLFLACGLWNPGGAGSGMATHLETILGTTMANGMGRVNPYVSPITTLANQNGPWWRNFLPQGSQRFGPGGNAYNVSSEDQKTYFSTPLEAWVAGYAYSHNDMTINLSMACLYVYATIATIFMLWSIASGVTSTSWNTVLELLALALKSPPPGKDELSGVSRGILSTEPLEQRYCLLAREDEVELVAIHRELLVENRVQPNKIYR